MVRTPSYDDCVWNQPTSSLTGSPATRGSRPAGRREAGASLQSSPDSKKLPTGPQRTHSAGSRSSSPRGLEDNKEVEARFVLKSRVEPYEGLWPKDSASPMVLPLDADTQIPGSVAISRLPSMEDFPSNDIVARFLHKGTLSRAASAISKLPETVEVELTDDTEDDASPRSIFCLPSSFPPVSLDRRFH